MSLAENSGSRSELALWPESGSEDKRQTVMPTLAVFHDVVSRYSWK